MVEKEKVKEKTNDPAAPTLKDFNLPETKDQEDSIIEGMCKYGMLASEAEVYLKKCPHRKSRMICNM